MKPFLGPDFLLDTDAARRLYYDHAADLPIIDYHNHLEPDAIAGNRHWDTVGEIWLSGDHYKWRAMRWAGVPEEKITGNATWREKFNAFAEICPRTVGNPLYHWCHLELWRHFSLDGTILSSATADTVWEVANAALATPDCRALGLMKRWNVAFVGTTDDPCDSLEHHAAHRASGGGPVMAPSFRPDPALRLNDDGFDPWIQRLETVSGVTIDSFEALVGALEARLDHFVAHGCRASDHALDVVPAEAPANKVACDRMLSDRRNGKPVSAKDVEAWQSALLSALGKAYAKRDLAMQLHISALRNNNTALFKSLGRDVGGDGMNDIPIAAPLNMLLDRMLRDDALPRTILYSVDPTKNATLVTVAGNFQGGGRRAHVQAGTAWWFNDQLDGMADQMTQLAQMGLLSEFLGMLTDSRSFLSFPRHEYFRRLLCQMMGRWMEDGHVPPDFALIGGIVEDISYRNARAWFMPE